MSQTQYDERLTFDLFDRLHKALRIGGHSATSLAAQLGMHRNTVNNYLSGRTAIDRRTLIAWAFACGVPVAWLESGETAEPDGDGPDGIGSQGGIAHTDEYLHAGRSLRAA